MQHQQLSLMQELELSAADEWCNDDWETPNVTAAKIATLIKPTEMTILEPAAGSGQLVKYLPDDRQIEAVELKAYRCNKGSKNHPKATWMQGDFLTLPLERFPRRYRLILANPPFSLRMEFIEKSLQLLEPSGRLLFLMPVDFNCGKAMGDVWKRLDCAIVHQYTFQNRVAYLDATGKPQPGRQIYDAVFDIRKDHEPTNTLI